MASPRRYLSLIQTLVDMDSAVLGIILPHLEQQVREAIYVAIANVIYHSKGRLDQSLRSQLNDILENKKSEIEKLAKKSVDKLTKRRMLRALSGEIQVILSAAIPMLIMSSGIRRSDTK